MKEPEAYEFRRSSHCADGTCVEIADATDGIFMRDSKVDDGPILRFGLEAWKAFVDAARAGEFD